MFDALIASLVAGLGAGVLLVAQNRFRPSERGPIWACYLAHVFCAGAMIWITANVLGGGDIFAYEANGAAVAELIEGDFRRYLPETLLLIAQGDAHFPFHVFAETSTGTMIGLSGLLQYLLFGSFAAASMVISLLAFSGQLAIYFGLRDYFAPHLHRRLQVATLLVPSVVFWSSGMQKEAVALAGLGWVTLGVLKFIRGEMRFFHLAVGILGILLVAWSKAYILMPLAAGAGIGWYWNRARQSGSSLTAKPIYFFVGMGIAVAGMVGIGELFPRFALTNIAEEAAHLQEVGQRVTGDSSYMIGDPTERSLAGQLAFAPVAMLTALFRPLIIEVHNAQALVNALETTAILYLFCYALYRRGVSRFAKLLFSSPALVFCLVFTLICAVGVGLTTTNLGTLSRYRAPLMPFFVTILLMLYPFRSRRDTRSS